MKYGLPSVSAVSSEELCGTVHCKSNIGINQSNIYFGLEIDNYSIFILLRLYLASNLARRLQQTIASGYKTNRQ